MRTVKQPKGSKICVAACIAMVTGESLDKVLARVPLSPEHNHVRMMDMVIALAAKGYTYGLTLEMFKSSLAPRDIRNLEVKVTELVAMVGVKSRTLPDASHMVVYDPDVRQFRDPDPDVGELCDWDEYDFLDWSPVVQFVDKDGEECQPLTQLGLPVLGPKQ